MSGGKFNDKVNLNETDLNEVNEIFNRHISDLLSRLSIVVNTSTADDNFHDVMNRLNVCGIQCPRCLQIYTELPIDEQNRHMMMKIASGSDIYVLPEHENHGTKTNDSGEEKVASLILDETSDDDDLPTYSDDDDGSEEAQKQDYILKFKVLKREYGDRIEMPTYGSDDDLSDMKSSYNDVMSKILDIQTSSVIEIFQSFTGASEKLS